VKLRDKSALKNLEGEIREISELVDKLKKWGVKTNLAEILLEYFQSVGEVIDEPTPEKIGGLSENARKLEAEFDSVQESILKASKTMSDVLSLLLIISDILITVGFVIWGIILSNSMSSAIKRVAKFLAELAEGGADLSRRITYKGNDEIALLCKNFNRFLDSLTEIVNKLKEASKDVVSSSQNTTEQVGKVYENFQDISQSLARISTAVSEFSSTIGESAKNAQSVSLFISSLNQKIKESSEVISSSLSSILSINQVFSKIQNKVRGIDEDSKKIFKIVSQISDISDQTNLLALNAAIEAARAGDKGKGFAVVADEVRKLAGRTRSLAGEISSLVSTFSDKMKEVIDDTSKAEEIISDSVLKAEKGTKALSEILKGASEAQNQVTNISTAFEEQARTSEEILRSVEEVSNFAEKGRENVESVKKEAEKLEKVSKNLDEITKQFKVKK
jgi:methyl-accepting chemotaxis protein